MTRPSSIRARMTLGFTAAVAVLMLLACGALIGYSRYAAARGADLLLNATAKKVLLQLAPGSGGPDQQVQQGESDHPLGGQPGETDDHQDEANGPQGEADNQQGQAGEQHVELSELIDQDRQDLQASNLALLIVSPDGRIAQRSQAQGPAWPRGADDGWKVLAVKFGAHTIAIGLPWARTAAALNSQATILLILCLFGVLIAAAGSWLLVGRTLSPIGALSRQARTASAESLRVSLSAPSQDAEVVELVATLNALLARLADTAAARGRFYAAASHELRTPLQALSGHLELALARPRTNEEYHAVLIEAREQSRLLTSLARALLWLHQLETAPRLPPREPVHLAEVCERMLTCFAPLIRQRGLRVQTGPWADTVILAPRSHCEMLIRNLIENAAQYASPGGAIRLELSTAAAGSELQIFNECSPCRESKAEPHFEPFCRPDASRSAGSGGNGLGLTICNAIAIANGWKLTWKHELGGVRAGVAFRTGCGPRP